jgi:hypothetical protein
MINFSSRPHDYIASLGEHRIRELNDEINKFMRQKNYWEKRIRELGGGDYHNMKRQISDVGKSLPFSFHFLALKIE